MVCQGFGDMEGFRWYGGLSVVWGGFGAIRSDLRLYVGIYAHTLAYTCICRHIRVYARIYVYMYEQFVGTRG